MKITESKCNSDSGKSFSNMRYHSTDGSTQHGSWWPWHTTDAANGQRQRSEYSIVSCCGAIFCSHWWTVSL